MPDTILADLVRISGFRGINNLEMHLARLTVLIGENNSGKTSILKALQLVLGDYGRQIAEEDFFIDAKDVRAEEIIVDVRIVPANGHGQRIPSFSIEWQTEFGDKIKAEPNGNRDQNVRDMVELPSSADCAARKSA